MLMMEFIDGSIGLEEENSLLEHIGVCKDCHQEFSLLRETIDLVEDMEEIAPPLEIESFVMESIDPKLYKERANGLIIMALVTVLSTIFIGGYFIYFKGAISILSNLTFFKDLLVAAFVDFVYFCVRVLPNILYIGKLILGALANIPMYLLGLFIVWLLILASASTYILKFLGYKARRN